MKRLLLGLVLAVLVAVPAAEAQLRNTRIPIMALTEVATGAPVTVAVQNVGATDGYLIIKTENETADASLVVTVTLDSPLGDLLLCTTGAITTDTTTYIGIGPSLNDQTDDADDEGVDEYCSHPLGANLNFIFTCSGADKDFDVTAELQVVAY